MVQPINSPQQVSFSSQQSGLTWFGQNGADFSDLIDVVNPLQHIPIVNTIYRELTGDEIGAAPRLAGGTLYGGPIGLAASAVNLGVEAMTGDDIGGHAWNFAFGEDTESAPDPTGAPGETDFAAAPDGKTANGSTQIATLNSPPAAAADTAAQPTGISQGNLPSGFVSLVQDSAWAPIGNPVDFVPGQGPVAINRPSTTAVAAAYQQQLPQNQAGQPPLPAVPAPNGQQVAVNAGQQIAAANVAQYDSAAAKPPIPLMHPRPSQAQLASVQTAPLPTNTATNSQAVPTLPAATNQTGALPQITPLGTATPQGSNGVTLPPVPSLAPTSALDAPASIQPEPQAPLGNQAPLALFDNEAAAAPSNLAPSVAPGAIPLAEELPGAIPQPAAFAGSAGEDVPVLDPNAPRDPLASADKLMPESFFATTESRYNAADPQAGLPKSTRAAADGSDYLVPDFKPNQVINHSQAAIQAGNPDLMLPEAMNGNARSLLDIAQTRPLPDWTVEAREQESQVKAARYQQHMTGQGGLFGHAAFTPNMGLYSDAPTRVTPLTWSRGNNSGNLL